MGNILIFQFEIILLGWQNRFKSKEDNMRINTRDILIIDSAIKIGNLNVNLLTCLTILKIVIVLMSPQKMQFLQVQIFYVGLQLSQNSPFVQECYLVHISDLKTRNLYGLVKSRQK
ncbi:Hypothetical_protein [Hexamita inflata]|uniref:Hypothetical_protein n=1 Tax=Hexamita inflata TaxID=28002 RepID=A0AA86PWH9_9EUKA|nr:Hypothetical protein HINF_LOCUS29439 [Hexamita inflata]